MTRPGSSGMSPAPQERTSRPCAIRCLNGVVTAYSASMCRPKWSPVRLAKFTTWVSVMVMPVDSRRSPTASSS
jgi:hypothetical protein